MAEEGIQFEDSEEDEFEEEDVVQREDQNSDDNEWEDCDSDAEMKEDKKKPKKEIWTEEKDPLKEDEELNYDGSAYIMLHRSKVEWPCLSIDWLLKERCGMTAPASSK